MNCILPDYEKGLVNAMSSIKRYFNIETNHSTLLVLDGYLKEKKYKNIVLVLFDGLGYNILKRNKKYCPFLNKNLISNISSTFPSTTMAARTTIETGLNPVEHGWLGWDVYFKQFDNVITLKCNYVKRTKEVITDYNIAKTLLKYEAIADKVNKIDGCYGKKINVLARNENQTLEKARDEIKEICSNDLKNYIYLYCDEPDQVFHKYGCDSKEAAQKLKEIDMEFKKLCNSLDDTLIIALADHGHLNVEYVTLSDYPEIINMLKGDVSIDNRACSFRVKDEYIKEFPKKLKKVLKDDFIIMSGKEVYDRKLFGDGVENKYYKDAIGDFFAIAVSNKSIRYDESVHMHKSGHSGITEEEMFVPLIVYKRDE